MIKNRTQQNETIDKTLLKRVPTENETVYYTICCHVSQHNRSERCQKEKKNRKVQVRINLWGNT